MPGSAVCMYSFDLDESALDFDLGLLDADVLGARGAAYGDEDLVGLDLLLLAVNREGHGDAVFGALDGFDLGVDEPVDAALAVHPHQFLGDFLVFDRNVAGQHFEDGDVGAEGLVDAGELDTYGARADDDERLGNVVEAENLDVGQDAVVGLESGQHAGDRASGEDQFLALTVDLPICLRLRRCGLLPWPDR